MSEKLQRDVKYANSILNNKCKDKFRKIYSNTNENLSILFDNLDLSKKDIFTVLSSADYLYMSYLKGAKNVDCFGINPLTYRYYFLRKWLFQNGIIDIEFSTFRQVNKILKNLTANNCQFEKESLIFWRNILMEIKEENFYKNPLFISTFNPFNLYYKDKLNNLSNILSSVNPIFYNIDICNYFNIDITKKYDYIFLSNILDYNRNNVNLKNTIRNLLSLINDNGKIICTHIAQFENDNLEKVLKLERDIFNKEFEYNQITYSENMLYYQYTKR